MVDVLRADVCPVCESEDVTGGAITVDKSEAYQGMYCEDCGARWVVAFRVWRIKIVEPTEVPGDRQMG